MTRVEVVVLGEGIGGGVVVVVLVAEVVRMVLVGVVEGGRRVGAVVVDVGEC